MKGTNKTFILAYVDDLLITRNNLKEIIQLKKDLTNFFNIKDLGKLKYFLGIEFTTTKQGLLLSQRKYATEILEQTNYLHAKPRNYALYTPSRSTHKQNEEEKLLEDPTEYRRIVGKLVYLTVTRPDIMYAVNTLSQQMAKPANKDTKKVNKVLRYIKNSPGRGIFFHQDQILMELKPSRIQIGHPSQQPEDPRLDSPSFSTKT